MLVLKSQLVHSHNECDFLSTQFFGVHHHERNFMPTFLRCILCLALLGCGSNQSGSMNSANAAPPMKSKSQSVTLVVGAPATSTQFGLSIQMLEATDSRCPEGARCVWAGHAQASLRLTRHGVAAETIVVGTEAPPSMNLPFHATSGDLTFSLTSLQSTPSAKNTTETQRALQATILIEKP